MHDTVGVNIEGDLNLRHTTWRRGNTGQLEVAQWLVICGKFTFTLENLNINCRLVVVCSSEGLGAFGWNSRVTLNELSHHATLGFNTQGQRSDVNQQDVFTVTGKHASLNGSTNRDNLIRVDATVWFFTTGQFFN